MALLKPTLYRPVLSRRGPAAPTLFDHPGKSPASIPYCPSMARRMTRQTAVAKHTPNQIALN